MTRRSRAARPAAPAEGPGGGALSVSAAAAANVNEPVVSAPRWPESALFRWEERAGPRDVWDTVPFPHGGPGVFGRLRDSVIASKLLRGHGEGRASTALSAELGGGSGASYSLPLADDDDMNKAVHLWGMCQGVPRFLAVAVHEGEGEGAAAAAALALPRAISGRVLVTGVCAFKLIHRLIYPILLFL